MQRIDENTYIDDSLVTCAEYQLFIDEMREQGKNYRPDHWTSDQFPEGKARDPILGVRQSDAVAFCGWLIGREAGEWNYRLPMRAEATQFSMKALGPSPLGYWLIEEHQFAWIGTVLQNPRKFNIEIVQHSDRTSVFDHEVGFDAALDIGYSTIFLRDLNGTHTFDNITNIIKYRLKIRGTAQPNLVYEFRDTEDVAKNRLVADLLTIQERIRGRSPAFEGIRLVKERIR